MIVVLPVATTQETCMLAGPRPVFLTPTSNDWILDRAAECSLDIGKLLAFFQTFPWMRLPKIPDSIFIVSDELDTLPPPPPVATAIIRKLVPLKVHVSEIQQADRERRFS